MHTEGGEASSTLEIESTEMENVVVLDCVV